MVNQIPRQNREDPGVQRVRELALEIILGAGQQPDVKPDIVAGILWDETNQASPEDDVQNRIAESIVESDNPFQQAAARAALRASGGWVDSEWTVSIGAAQMQPDAVIELITGK